MKQILIGICCLVVVCGFVSCSDQNVDNKDFYDGPGEPVFFLPQDTFGYDSYEQTDTILIYGLPVAVGTIYDIDNEESIDCSDETNIQYKWLAIELVDNELILSLAENPMTDMRRMWVWLCNGDYYKRIYIVQNGENIKPVNMRCL